MGKTIADQLKEEGAREGERRGERRGERNAAIMTRQQTLVRLLKKRFGEVPTGMTDTIRATRDVQQLDRWLDQCVTVERLDDFDFGDV